MINEKNNFVYNCYFYNLTTSIYKSTLRNYIKGYFDRNKEQIFCLLIIYYELKDFVKSVMINPINMYLNGLAVP